MKDEKHCPTGERHSLQCEHCQQPEQPNFRKELEELLNKHSKDTEANTPDFILAEYIMGCLMVFEDTVIKRNQWYASSQKPSSRA